MAALRLTHPRRCNTLRRVLLATEVNEIKAGTAEAAANGVIMNGAGVVMNGAAGHSCGGGCGGAGLDW